MAGYSSTPLVRKLGYKAGTSVEVLQAPDYYFSLLKDLPEELQINTGSEPRDLIHYFATEAKQLHADLPKLKSRIRSSGCIWISWPKKASGVRTDINEDLIRTLALREGLVDIKVCAVDETWSALKLVIPVHKR